MASVTGLTAARMLAIEGASVVGASISNFVLTLTRQNGTTINLGSIRGAQGIQGPQGAPGLGNIQTVNGITDPNPVLTASTVGAIPDTRAATTTVLGGILLATAAEVQAGSDAVKAVTAATLNARTATETRTGIVELATTAEVAARSDATRAISPANMNSHPGLPWAMAAGDVPDASIAATSNLATTITFPSGRFSQAPIVTAVLRGDQRFLTPQVDVVNATSFILRRGNMDGTARIIGAQWQAVQMTSAAGAG